MQLHVSADTGPEIAQGPELVERKGLGHPDSICDALAERLSAALCRFYFERFGTILHHNVDKALLWGGAAKAAFGGGEVTAPMELFLAGRAVAQAGGIPVPVNDLAVQTTLDWFKTNLPNVDTQRHLKIHCLVRPTSLDLSDLYARQRRTGRWQANDTSCGVGYAPESPLERMVLTLEGELNSPAFRTRNPAHGEDVKIMALVHSGRVQLTVARAFVGRHVQNLDHYLALKAQLGMEAVKIADTAGAGGEVAVGVNVADEPATGSIYLTVTGTSAEAGDDGQAGRGNRINGLITPYRPMSIESVAGKNPVTHIGKLYNLVARDIARDIVARIPAVHAARCFLMSKIGSPIDDPAIADIRTAVAEKVPAESLTAQVRDVVRNRLARLEEYSERAVKGESLLA